MAALPEEALFRGLLQGCLRPPTEVTAHAPGCWLLWPRRRPRQQACRERPWRMSPSVRAPSGEGVIQTTPANAAFYSDVGIT